MQCRRLLGWSTCQLALLEIAGKAACIVFGAEEQPERAPELNTCEIEETPLKTIENQRTPNEKSHEYSNEDHEKALKITASHEKGFAKKIESIEHLVWLTSTAFQPLKSLLGPERGACCG